MALLSSSGNELQEKGLQIPPTAGRRSIRGSFVGKLGKLWVIINKSCYGDILQSEPPSLCIAFGRPDTKLKSALANFCFLHHVLQREEDKIQIPNSSRALGQLWLFLPAVLGNALCFQTNSFYSGAQMLLQIQPCPRKC